MTDCSTINYLLSLFTTVLSGGTPDPNLFTLSVGLCNQNLVHLVERGINSHYLTSLLIQLVSGCEILTGLCICSTWCALGCKVVSTVTLQQEDLFWLFTRVFREELCRFLLRSVLIFSKNFGFHSQKPAGVTDRERLFLFVYSLCVQCYNTQEACKLGQTQFYYFNLNCLCAFVFMKYTEKNCQIHTAAISPQNSER